ncbi:hypothetical protein TNCV_3863031 [Trichonephila clavipes]|uniref:Uncharacterized protein n=1 Tax=Trichonephila clavipes TaxID=2585209 RepID=A0A8X6S370_TRICX|nr:hypothetical protein TNCV_3863031 [Trichonephila clavipes]
MHVKSPVGVVWKLEEGVPAQVSSSLLGHGSKLRRPSPKGLDDGPRNIHSLTHSPLETCRVEGLMYVP